MAAEKVLLYELNEVPWDVVDVYVERRPRSHLAKVLRRARQETTRNEDPEYLTPWRAWPTFHKGVYTTEHNSWELGQDPDSYAHHPNIWDVAEAEGRSVGLWGVLQSWPARRFRNGGFYVPDTFAQTPDTDPPQFRKYQQLNLSMTQELGFSADAPLKPTRLAGFALDLVRRGVTPWSAAQLARRVVRERRDARHKASRSIVQVMAGFDVFWRQHRAVDPDLSIFFTNHVAGMMHRFWGDTMPGFTDNNDYAPDEVWGSFIIEAMDVMDHQLGRMLKFVGSRPDTVLIIAAAIGQGPAPYHHIGDTYVLTDGDRLITTLGLDGARNALAMYPMGGLNLPSDEAAVHAAQVLGSVELAGEPLFGNIRLNGRGLTYGIRLEYDGQGLDHAVTYQASGETARRTGTIEDLGVTVEQRLGGGNTGHHVPEGIFLTLGTGIEPDDRRLPFDVREAPARIAGHLGIAEAWAAARVST